MDKIMKKETLEKVRSIIDSSFETIEGNTIKNANDTSIPQTIYAYNSKNEESILKCPFNPETKKEVLIEVGVYCYILRSTKIALLSDIVMNQLNSSQSPQNYPLIVLLISVKKP
jgi:hypothetical protein